ncbi:MAG: hypothetical protein F4Y07_03855, partial [Gemmatimonadetes bacterium]|nr:hypothetical protein [Gemmatimonadota bacterium]
GGVRPPPPAGGGGGLGGAFSLPPPPPPPGGGGGGGGAGVAGFSGGADRHEQLALGGELEHRVAGGGRH